MDAARPISSILSRGPQTDQAEDVFTVGKAASPSDQQALDLAIQLNALAKKRPLTRAENKQRRWAFKRCRERGLLYKDG